MSRNRLFTGLSVVPTVVTSAVAICLLTVSLSACKQKGPVERAGEEVDEAIDTAKHGGKESLTNKADDAVDDVNKGMRDAAHDLKKD